MVVNYDFPIGTNGIESYVHRIGRTARGNASGTDIVNNPDSSRPTGTLPSTLQYNLVQHICIPDDIPV